MHLLKCFLDCNSSINLLLCDTCQLSTKWCELSIDRRLDISLIDSLNGFLFDVNDHNRELYDLLSGHWVVNFVFRTCALKIVDAYVVKGRLVQVSLTLKVEYHPKVLSGYAAILEAL